MMDGGPTDIQLMGVQGLGVANQVESDEDATAEVISPQQKGARQSFSNKIVKKGKKKILGNNFAGT